MRKKQKNVFDRKVFAAQVKFIRNKLNLNQEDLAAKLNRSRNAIAMMEGEKITPSIDFLIELVLLARNKNIPVSLDQICGTTFKYDDPVIKAKDEKIRALEKELSTYQEIASLQKQLLGKPTR